MVVHLNKAKVRRKSIDVGVIVCQRWGIGLRGRGMGSGGNGRGGGGRSGISMVPIFTHVHRVGLPNRARNRRVCKFSLGWVEAVRVDGW